MQLNLKVAVVVCPECHEPVIADVALYSRREEAATPVMIRHHVHRQVRAGGTVQYCLGSKQPMLRAIPVSYDELVALSGQVAEPQADMTVEFGADKTATIIDRTKEK